MKKQLLCAMAAAGVVLISACNKPADDAQKPATATAADAKSGDQAAVATVNGKAITKALFQSTMAELAMRSGGQEIPADKLLDDMIAREVLRQDAEKQNLAKDPAIAAKIEDAVRNVLVQANVENFRKTATVTDEELKKEYDTRVNSIKATEFKARHILVETEQAAKDALTKLQKGAKFEELAKKLSKDPSAKQNGGELGWFNPQQMVPEFTAAVAAMKNGETVAAPVKSQFGWHVIQRQDSRDLPPPPFDAVKDQIRGMMLGQKLQKHVEGLKTAAKIERFELPKPAAAKAEVTAPAAAAAAAAPAAATPAAAPAAAPAPAAPAAAPVAAPAPAAKP